MAVKQGGEVRYKPRVTENTAIVGVLNFDVPDLTRKHKRVLNAEREAIEICRTGKRLYGNARWKYMARRTGLGIDHVRQLLTQADGIIFTRSLAGLQTVY